MNLKVWQRQLLVVGVAALALVVIGGNIILSSRWINWPYPLRTGCSLRSQKRRKKRSSPGTIDPKPRIGDSSKWPSKRNTFTSRDKLNS